MKIIEVLTTSVLFLLPGAIAPAYAQGQRDQQKQPEQHQQQGRPAQQTQRAAQQEQARPAQQTQRQGAAQQARSGQQRQGTSQQANRAQYGGGRRSIPEARFQESFGRSHTFHVNRADFYGGSRRFQYGGYWFDVVDPWPVGWLYTDDVYVDYLNGGYFLCDPYHPVVYIAINIG